MTPKKAVVIINKGSRSGRLQGAHILGVLRSAGVNPIETIHCLGREFPRVMTQIENGDFDCLIACGGDGTVGAFAETCIKKNIPLGIIPLGTGNSFARRMGIPLDISLAAKAIGDGLLKPAEVGYCNDILFLDLCSFGLSQTIKDNLSPDLKKLLGRGAYVFALLNSVPKIQPLEIKITVDEHTFKVSTYFLAVGPGVLHGGFAVLHPEAKPNDGKLHGYYLLGGDITSILQLPVAIMSGAPGAYPGINALVGRDIFIESSEPIQVVLDGESRAETPIHLCEKSNAIQVFVPQSAEYLAYT